MYSGFAAWTRYGSCRGRGVLLSQGCGLFTQWSRDLRFFRSGAAGWARAVSDMLGHAAAVVQNYSG